MRICTILLILFICAPVYAQEHKSIHQSESEKYSQYNYKNESDFGKAENGNSSNRNSLNKTVFGWNPYWIGTAYTDYDYSLLSHVGYFSYEVDTATGGYTTIHYWSTTNIIPLAHSYGTKVVLTVTNFGSACNTALLSNPLKRQTLINTLINLVLSRNADGVNIDFEIVPASQRQNLVVFMTDLSNTFHNQIPNSNVSICLPPVDWNNSFDIPGLNSVCDLLIMMGYDYYWSGSSNAGPNAPLQSNGFWGSYYVANSVNNYLAQGVSAQKFCLGVPYYGYEWPTQTNIIKSTTTGTGTAYSYSTMKINTASYGRIWDTYSLTPWYRYQLNTWHQGWYDDSVSLGIKYDFVNSLNLKGIGIWALSYDGSNRELWNLIARKFTTQTGIIRHETGVKNYELRQNYPNPFNPSSEISFYIPASGNVKISVYNIRGQKVETLEDKDFNTGLHSITWNADKYPSGIYLIKMQSGMFSDVKRAVLIK